MPRAMLSLLLLFLGFVLLSCTGKQTGRAEELYTKNCLNCHSRSIICLHLGEDKEYWDETVSRMLHKNNQQVSSEVVAMLVDFLSQSQPGAKQVCQRTGSQS